MPRWVLAGGDGAGGEFFVEFGDAGFDAADTFAEVGFEFVELLEFGFDDGELGFEGAEGFVGAGEDGGVVFGFAGELGAFALGAEFGAGFFGFDHFFDFGKGEAQELLEFADEFDVGDVCFGVEAEAAFHAVSGGEEAFFFVEAEGALGDAGAFGDFADLVTRFEGVEVAGGGWGHERGLSVL